VPIAGSGGYVTVVHTANDWPATTSNKTAVALVTAQAAAMGTSAGIDAARAEQAAWWAAYWPTSFLSVPDTAVEAMWVLQMAKVSAATRRGGVAMDLMGPWWFPSGWELYWWSVEGVRLALLFPISILSLSLRHLAL